VFGCRLSRIQSVTAIEVHAEHLERRRVELQRHDQLFVELIFVLRRDGQCRCLIIVDFRSSVLEHSLQLARRPRKAQRSRPPRRSRLSYPSWQNRIRIPDKKKAASGRLKTALLGGEQGGREETECRAGLGQRRWTINHSAARWAG
jgi:hypothetical protein